MAIRRDERIPGGISPWQLGDLLITPPEKRPAAARTNDSSVMRRLAYSGVRWARLLVLALLGAVAFELIVPLAWQRAKSVQPPYSPAFVALTSCMAVVMLTYVISEPIRIRKRQWRRILWYPPTWLAVPIAWGLAAASERLPIALRPQSGGPDWQHAYIVGPIAAAIALGLAARQLPWRRAAGSVAGPEAGTGFTWSEIEAWISAGERPLASGERDLFQHQRIAARIVRNVVVERRDVALLGRFGSGKSSIINLVRSEIARRPETLIVADFDVWAVPNPEDVPRLALNRVISALDDYVDTIRFRGLPVAYQRLAAAEPTGRLSAALGFETAGDSIELLDDLSKVLAAIDAQIVLVVQDLERSGAGFDTRHLQRLLWALRNAKSIQFILSVDPDAAVVDFPKLCESIELVPELEVEQVATILKVARDHWRAKFSDIDPHPNRRNGDKLRLDQALADGMSEYLRKTGRDTPLDALVSLLRTPRALKHVLRRVDYAWSNLHGEAELDDIIIVSALRHGAEPVYRFLLADIDAARHKADEMFPRTKNIKDEWSRVLAEVSAGGAVEKLVDLMGIEQLRKETIRTGSDSPQGVQVSEPVDYFRRIVAEELGPSELRDQAVLRDIDEWKATRSGPLVERLLQSSDADDEYARVWEHFAYRQTDAELMELVQLLVAKIKEHDGSAAAGDHRALIGLWRRCNRRLRHNEHADWLQALIVGAIPVSLNLANDLFYYWTGKNGIVDNAARSSIRQVIVETVRASIRTGDELARALKSDEPYQIGRLVTQTGSDRSLAALEAWRDYLPAVLIEGANKHPELVIPELANLVGDEQSGMVAAGGEYPPRFINRYGIDRARMAALFGDKLDEALSLLVNYRGDNAYAVRAIQAAREWSDERRSSAPPTVT